MLWKTKSQSDLPVVEFPKQFWFYRPEFWSFFYATLWNKIKFGMPIFKGGDEYGRHTLNLFIPGIIGLVIPYKLCGPGCPDYDDPEMRMPRCAFPGCPYFSHYSVPYEESFCMTHHESFWREYVEEERAKIEAANTSQATD